VSEITTEGELEVFDVLGPSDVEGRLVGVRGDANAAVVVLALGEDAEDPEERWVVDGSVGVIGALGRLSAAGAPKGRQRPVTVLVWTQQQGEPRRRAAAEAAFEAARGIAQTATREDSTAALRVNVVAGGPDEAADVVRTVAFLSCAAGGFVAGSTFDLRGTR